MDGLQTMSVLAVLLAASIASAPVVAAAAEPQTAAAAALVLPPDPVPDPIAAAVDRAQGKPRVAVISDIGNEPDDQMSFIRLLVYSNQLDLEALIAGTSVWQKQTVRQWSAASAS